METSISKSPSVFQLISLGWLMGCISCELGNSSTSTAWARGCWAWKWRSDPKRRWTGSTCTVHTRGQRRGHRDIPVSALDWPWSPTTRWSKRNDHLSPCPYWNWCDCPLLPRSDCCGPTANCDSAALTKKPKTAIKKWINVK